MNELAVTRSVQRGELDANAVLKEAWRIYRRLFARSLGIGAIVFGVVHFLDVAGHGTLIAVTVLEGGSAGDALRCSREIVRGNGWNVFKVVFATGVLTTATGLLFGLASAGLGASGMWLMLTLGSALTAPYAAHALTVVYYALREPDRPVVLEPGQREHQQWRDG